MIKPRCGRLNPAEPALPNDLFPGNRNFRVTAKNIGRKQFSVDALLPRIDHFGVRDCRFDLRDMLRARPDNKGRSGRSG